MDEASQRAAELDGEAIVECPLCLQKNRFRPHANWEKPVCARCKTSLPTGRERHGRDFRFAQLPYHALWRDIDLPAQVLLNAATSEPGRMTDCLKCGRQTAEHDGIRLNDRKFVCADCLGQLLAKRWPEKYELQQSRYTSACSRHREQLASYFEGLACNRVLKLMSPSGKVLAMLALTGWALLALREVHPWCSHHVFACAATIALLCVFTCELVTTRCRAARAGAVRRWLIANPYPPKPVVKDFLDEDADLTPQDRQLLDIIHHWPGDPPFWGILRRWIIQRDGCRCQVTGCPSLSNLHVHHRKARFRGGSHHPDNLVTLCDYHHGTMEGSGHSQILGDALALRSTPVTRQLRKGVYSTSAILRDVINHCGLACPGCNGTRLDVVIRERESQLLVTCESCSRQATFQRHLPEVNGPEIARAFVVTRNSGRIEAG